MTPIAATEPHSPSSSRAWTVVLGLALVHRTLYLVSYLELPFLYGPLFDSQVYLLQARRIAEARFGDPVLLAFSPLYGYILALLDAHQGSLLPVLVQLGLGCLSVRLLYSITRRMFGLIAAVCAAIGYLGYGPLLFFETKVMSETLGLFLLLSALALITRPSFARAEPKPCCAAGAVLALAVLTRASLLPVLPLLAASCLLTREDEPAPYTRAPRLRRTAMLSLTLLLLLGAHGAWTKHHSGLFVPVILVSNTAARATQQTFQGDLSIFRGKHEEDVSAFSVVHQAQARLDRLHKGLPEPHADSFSLSGYLAQLPQKLALTLRDKETSFDYGFYGERSEVWPLRLSFVSFGMLLTFAAVGLVGALRRHRLRPLLPLIAVALGTLVTTTMFHPSTRYRLQLVVLLLPLAGYAWQLALTREPGKSRWRAVAALSLVGLSFALWQGLRPLENPALWQLRVAESALEEGDAAAARERVRSALSLAPTNPQVARHARRLMARLPPLAAP